MLFLLTEGIDGFNAGVTVRATAGCIFGGVDFALAAVFATLVTGLALADPCLWEDRDRVDDLADVLSLTGVALVDADASLGEGTLGAESRSNVRRRSARLRRADDGSALLDRSLPTGDTDPLRKMTQAWLRPSPLHGKCKANDKMSAADHAPKPLYCGPGSVHL